jgi:hypothetical protein
MKPSSELTIHRFCLCLLWIGCSGQALSVQTLSVQTLSAQQKAERIEGVAIAPPNTRQYQSAIGGGYYVDRSLLDRYEATKTELEQAKVAFARGSGEPATLAALNSKLEALLDEIEGKKVLVLAFRVRTKTTEEIIPVGDEGLVIITADDVIVRGWDGPGIKCVVEKTVLGKEEPQESDLDAIQIDHDLTIAEEQVGVTAEKREEQEIAYMSSEAGKKLTDEQKQQRVAFIAGIRQNYDDYLAFQGRKSNTIRLKGLAYDQGNRFFTMRIESPGGGGSVGSQKERHAKMTVFLPPCKAVLIRGCQVGLDVQGITCDLVLTTSGSTDRRYDGRFTVRGVRGNVTIVQAPVRELSVVTGNVRITATEEFVNSGMGHSAEGRAFSPYDTHVTTISNVHGDLQGTFLRADLRLLAIQGQLDVRNEFGSTLVTLNKPPSEKQHCILSESGTIVVKGPLDVLKAASLYAHTQCGTLRTNLSRDVLADKAFSTGQPRIGWHGMVKPSDKQFDFGMFERPAAALANSKRKPGLDLISRAGAVSILANE